MKKDLNNEENTRKITKADADNFANALVYVLFRASTYVYIAILAILPYKLVSWLLEGKDALKYVEAAVIIIIAVVVIFLRTRIRMTKKPTAEMKSFKLYRGNKQ